MADAVVDILAMGLDQKVAHNYISRCLQSRWPVGWPKAQDVGHEESTMGDESRLLAVRRPNGDLVERRTPIHFRESVTVSHSVDDVDDIGRPGLVLLRNGVKASIVLTKSLAAARFR